MGRRTLQKEEIERLYLWFLDCEQKREIVTASGILNVFPYTPPVIYHCIQETWKWFLHKQGHGQYRVCGLLDYPYSFFLASHVLRSSQTRGENRLREIFQVVARCDQMRQENHTESHVFDMKRVIRSYQIEILWAQSLAFAYQWAEQVGIDENHITAIKLVLCCFFREDYEEIANALSPPVQAWLAGTISFSELELGAALTIEEDWDGMQHLGLCRKDPASYSPFFC